MQKKNLLIIGFAGLALLSTGAFAYQLNSNQQLKSKLAENQEDIPLDDTVQTGKATKYDASVNVKSKPTTRFIDEADLLADFFAEPPTMIAPDTANEPNIDEVKSGPSLLVTPQVFDLGQISKADGFATATFTLKNEGNKPLTISYAFSSCGCTVAPLKDEKILQPGESFPLEVTYDPNYYGPHYELGPIEKTVTVLSNYTVRPFYKVKLKANVVP